MDPSDNQLLAQFLISPPRKQPEEACFRAGCGRAYYAAFAFARDALEGAGFTIPADASAHQAVVRLLKRSRETHVKAVGLSLDSLRTLRNTADYDLGLRTKPGGFTKWQGQTATASGATIINELRAAVSKDSTLSIR